MKLFRRFLPAAILGIIGAFATTLVFSRATVKVDGFVLTGSLSLSTTGQTRVSLPPFGSISAQTHSGPVRVNLALEKVSLNQLQKLADERVSKQELLATAQVEAYREGKAYLWRLAVASFLGALAFGAAWFRFDPARLVVAGAAGLAAVALVAGVVVRSFDIKAFRQPTYHGALTSAPWLMNTLEEKLNDLRKFRQQAKVLAAGAYDFYRKVGHLPAPPPKRDQVVLLHVGDIHNNPVGLDLTKRVAADFQVDAVVDTGDITDFGTPLESKMLDSLARIKVPYYFLAGNHDSPEVIERLRRLPKVRVLNGDVATVGPLSILGFSDPASKTGATQVSQTPSQADSLARKYAAAYQDLAKKPQVVAVHEPANGEELVGAADVIISGHSHSAAVREVKGTVMENVGSSGAAGIRGLKKKAAQVYTLQLLRFDRTTTKLVSVDTIALDALAGDFSIERRTMLRH